MTTDVDAFLEHHGVKGQKWGVRNKSLDRVSRVAGGTADRRALKNAKKDAEEFARAKLFYGQGAGTRRKLIKNTVEARKKNDPVYAAAFEKHLADQDLSVHASKAQKERSRIDRKEKGKKSASFLARHFTGEMGTQAAFTALALSGAAFLASPKGRQIVKSASHKMQHFATNARAQAMQKKGAAHIAKMLRDMG